MLNVPSLWSSLATDYINTLKDWAITIIIIIIVIIIINIIIIIIITIITIWGEGGQILLAKLEYFFNLDIYSLNSLFASFPRSLPKETSEFIHR